MMTGQSPNFAWNRGINPVSPLRPHYRAERPLVARLRWGIYSQALRKEPSMAEKENLQLAEQMIAAVNARDLDRY
jgi:hypothetical protein